MLMIRLSAHQRLFAKQPRPIALRNAGQSSLFNAKQIRAIYRGAHREVRIRSGRGKNKNFSSCPVSQMLVRSGTLAPGRKFFRDFN